MTTDLYDAFEHVGGEVDPDALSRSHTFGRTPVARKRPITLPSARP